MRLMVISAPVPERYRGVWQRSLLVAPGVHDTTTTVLWMQTGRWHADLRIAAGRPDFSGVVSLDDCSADQLAWLATQQGFAGITEVVTTSGDEVCAWHRLVDVQPPGLTADAGVMEFTPACLIETGVHGPYIEHWIALPQSQGEGAVYRCGGDQDRLQLLLVAGNYVMRVCDRRSAWPEGVAAGTTLTQLLPALPLPQQRSLLDIEISFGIRVDGEWQIRHSSLPWLEGLQVTFGVEDAGSPWRELELHG
ncbi:hypothetical protein QN362_06900 [Actimicrobium sp. CCC2.4]|uniref:hypothetical protein n=1 Tax=Actimicrobium sp. CCC2.4 TaxID=3048606 RepID=UPI002AC8DE81|nr:hypothetical protein [Actimicrobium sp. CCC2.4]MEB0135053.1 hypothetical protein [Actimicrobium sp. CCC2.4]WPX31899.1 hypothetical protein RHM62_16935 [Actimicrobium sp. CCC2.4]